MNNSKGWMRKDLWQMYLYDFDIEIQSWNRHVLLLCDNGSSHSHETSKYANLSTNSIPPNPTAWQRPVDSGIIRDFKANYCHQLTSLAADTDAQGARRAYHIQEI